MSKECEKRANNAAQNPAAKINKSEQSEPANHVIGAPRRFGHEMAQNVAAVEGRHGYEIENCQDHIDDQQLVNEEAEGDQERVRLRGNHAEHHAVDSLRPKGGGQL